MLATGIKGLINPVDNTKLSCVGYMAIRAEFFLIIRNGEDSFSNPIV